MPRLSASTIALLSASAFWQPAFAEDAFDVEAYDDSRTIIVTGLSEGYLATNSVTATKTDTPLIDIPQTINVVTREQLDDQAHHSLADILRYVPGTTVGQGEGNRDQITLRWQKNGTRATMASNSLRRINQRDSNSNTSYWPPTSGLMTRRRQTCFMWR